MGAGAKNSVNATLRAVAAACGLAVLTSAVSVSAALALDEKIVTKAPERSPLAVFRFGFTAYKKGNKEEAVEAYRYAAENGQIGARWKLARMYAEGDGVPRDDYEAFKFFNDIVRQEVEIGSPDEPYVSDALVAVANYLRTGIDGSPVQPNLSAAQDYYMRAAATYRNPVAQYEVGRMFLTGEGVKKNVRQAGRWLQLAAEKGHVGAQATLGNMLFESGKVVQGLAMLTAALERARNTDLEWIRRMQEEAFALAAESDRRTAIALAGDMLHKASH
jgi:TPR repeat protein